MARRTTDTSKAKCRTCGKPLLPNEARYTIADKWDDDAPEDVNILVEFEHWECHTPLEKLLDDARDLIARAQRLTSKLRR